MTFNTILKGLATALLHMKTGISDNTCQTELKFYLKKKLLFSTMAILLIGLSSGCKDDDKVDITPEMISETAEVPEFPCGENTPILEIIHVPAFNSSENLKGQVCHVKYQNFIIVTYLHVTGWWSKPTFNNPSVSIDDDGEFTVDVTTGGVDRTANAYAIFLLPVNYSPPPMSGQLTLPSSLFQDAVAYANISRTEDNEVSSIVNFAGYEWLVKNSSEDLVGPGPNYFSNSQNSVWVDSLDRLHLTIKKVGNKWICSEVISRKSFGRGTYRFYLETPASALDENAVLGFFSWDDNPEDNHREIDIEISKWSESNNQVLQYVVQPYQMTTNIHRFDIDHNLYPTIHSFNWQSASIYFRSLKGSEAENPDALDILNSWEYVGENIPSLGGNENARINLWLNHGNEPVNGENMEIIISKFEFIP